MKHFPLIRKLSSIIRYPVKHQSDSFERSRNRTMTISLSWSVTSQLRSREFPLTARRKSESESKQRIRGTEMGLLQTGPRSERRGGDGCENGVEREEERVNLRARVRESRGSLAGTARACISSRPVTPLYGTRTEPVAFHRCSCWDLHRRCQATAQ